MSDDRVCTACGYVGTPERVTKGSFGVELILWICFLVPGLIYSIWRITTRHDGCPKCGNQALIPKDSPMAQKFLRENMPETLVTPSNPTRPPSAAAVSAGKALGQAVGRILK